MHIGYKEIKRRKGEYTVNIPSWFLERSCWFPKGRKKNEVPITMEYSDTLGVIAIHPSWTLPVPKENMHALLDDLFAKNILKIPQSKQKLPTQSYEVTFIRKPSSLGLKIAKDQEIKAMTKEGLKLQRKIRRDKKLIEKKMVTYFADVEKYDTLHQTYFERIEKIKTSPSTR